MHISQIGRAAPVQPCAGENQVADDATFELVERVAQLFARFAVFGFLDVIREEPIDEFFLDGVGAFVPFGFASFYPASKLLGKPEYQSFFLLLPVVAAVFLTAAFLLWNRGVSNYESTGS